MADSTKYQGSPSVARLILFLALANLLFLFLEIAFNVFGSILPF